MADKPSKMSAKLSLADLNPFKKADKPGDVSAKPSLPDLHLIKIADKPRPSKKRGLLAMQIASVVVIPKSGLKPDNENRPLVSFPLSAEDHYYVYYDGSYEGEAGYGDDCVDHLVKRSRANYIFFTLALRAFLLFILVCHL